MLYISRSWWWISQHRRQSPYTLCGRETRNDGRFGVCTPMFRQYGKQVERIQHLCRFASSPTRGVAASLPLTPVCVSQQASSINASSTSAKAVGSKSMSAMMRATSVRLMRNHSFRVLTVASHLGHQGWSLQDRCRRGCLASVHLNGFWGRRYKLVLTQMCHPSINVDDSIGTAGDDTPQAEGIDLQQNELGNAGQSRSRYFSGYWDIPILVLLYSFFRAERKPRQMLKGLSWFLFKGLGFED